MVFLIAAAFSCAGTLHGQEAPAPVDYQREVLPILENHCFECHTGGNVNGNLRLNSRAGLDERGFSGLPIVAATLDESELILRITSDDEEFRMPRSAPALSEHEIALLTNWVAQGAPYEATALPAKPASEERSLTDRLGDGYVHAQELLLQKPYRYAAIVLAPFLLYLVLVVAAIAARHQSAKRDAAAEVRFPWARLNPFLLITLIFWRRDLYRLSTGADGRIRPQNPTARK